jgi:ABC-type proline/glycine betaine transport system ATPase subunit
MKYQGVDTQEREESPRNVWLVGLEGHENKFAHATLSGVVQRVAVP